MRRCLGLTLLFCAQAALTACVPDVTEAPQVAAETYCDRAVECGWTDEVDLEDCIDLSEDIFSAFWPEEDCSAGLEREGWNTCMDTLENLDCESSLSGWPADIGEACDLVGVCATPE